MRAIILLILVLCASSFQTYAQSGVPAMNEELYGRLKRKYIKASHDEVAHPLEAFFVAAGQTFDLGNDTARRIFKEFEKAHQELTDSAIIVQMLSPVIHHFLDSDYMQFVCPAGYERAEPAMAAYSEYMCGCIPDQQENMARYDTSAQLVDAIGACFRIMRFNDSLKARVMGGLTKSGIAVELLDPCANAYIYSHCAHLRNTITRLCCDMSLRAYRLGKTTTLYQLANYAEYCLSKGKSGMMSRKFFDSDEAATAMDDAAYWASPELKSFDRLNIMRYVEVHNYGHELVMTYLIDAGSKPQFILQVTFALRWSGGVCYIAGVHLTKPKFIQDKDLILQGSRKMRQKTPEHRFPNDWMSTSHQEADPK